LFTDWLRVYSKFFEGHFENKEVAEFLVHKTEVAFVGEGEMGNNGEMKFGRDGEKMRGRERRHCEWRDMARQWLGA
jgi:hypothetical protein